MFGRLQLELSGDQEDKYREFHLRKDIKQARIAILLFAVPLFGFAFNDYQFFGLSSEFFGIVALRLGLLFYTVYELIQIGKVKSYRNYDRSITAYASGRFDLQRDHKRDKTAKLRCASHNHDYCLICDMHDHLSSVR